MEIYQKTLSHIANGEETGKIFGLVLILRQPRIAPCEIKPTGGILTASSQSLYLLANCTFFPGRGTDSWIGRCLRVIMCSTRNCNTSFSVHQYSEPVFVPTYHEILYIRLCPKLEFIFNVVLIDNIVQQVTAL